MTHPTEGTTASPPQTDPNAAYEAAYRAFTEHIAGCHKCRHRGVDCQTVKPIKARLRETRKADIAEQASVR